MTEKQGSFLDDLIKIVIAGCNFVKQSRLFVSAFFTTFSTLFQ
jgi:hypothetical protein